MVPDGLWELARPLIPEDRVRPQGGGTQNTPDETPFAAIIYVLVSGCSWRALPPCFGVPKSTVHRRFTIWSRVGAPMPPRSARSSASRPSPRVPGAVGALSRQVDFSTRPLFEEYRRSRGERHARRRSPPVSRQGVEVSLTPAPAPAPPPPPAASRMTGARRRRRAISAPPTSPSHRGVGPCPPPGLIGSCGAAISMPSSFRRATGRDGTSSPPGWTPTARRPPLRGGRRRSAGRRPGGRRASSAVRAARR